MLKPILFTLLIACVPQLAAASFWVECDVDAEVLRVSESHYSIRVTASSNATGHADSCPIHKGDVLEVPVDQLRLPAVGEAAALHYQYYNAMGPNGAVEDTRWTLR